MERNGQECLPGLSTREVLEQQLPEVLLAYKEHLLDKYNAVEKEIHLVNDVLDGYGVNNNIVLGEN